MTGTKIDGIKVAKSVRDRVKKAVDELYYVIKGDGFLKINQRDYPIEEGKIFFVPKNIQHCFFGNKKELIVIYFFGGPDS